jgi:hypothetical protein
MEKQIDIFGNEIDISQIENNEARKRKRYRSMQAMFGTKEGYRCATCKHCEQHHYHNKKYYKCKLWFQSHSAATDIRLKDTACKLYESEE